jgi:P4 family phage/plasmid primase-like protien
MTVETSDKYSSTSSADTIPISKDVLVESYKMGFKLMPLNGHNKEVEPWTPIYDNPNYWTPEKLEQESYKFKNVATCFGKTHLKDEKGRDLYLNCLDIDSDSVYDILFNLENSRTREGYSFTAKVQDKTFVTKTKKRNGFHVYWFSHKQNNPICVTRCRKGYEFEIKTDKTQGHCTLPPSKHREDPSFHYSNYGQRRILVSDELYDQILKVLEDCLKPIGEDTSKGNYQLQNVIGTNISKLLSTKQLKSIHENIAPYYKKGYRHFICYTLSGLLHKLGIDFGSAKTLLELVAKDDEEIESRLRNLKDTYNKNREEVSGYKAFLEVLKSATGDDRIASDLLSTTLNILINNHSSKESADIYSPDHVQLIVQELTGEFTFKTMRDTEEAYIYDAEKGLFIGRADILIKEHTELLYPEITTSQVCEIINKIRRRTYCDRTDFDKDPNIINTKNGLLNVITGEVEQHNPKYLSLVQLPITYDPKATCPNILRFLGQVLRPKDVFTALELFGYCICKTAKYEKAILCFGNGDNGKGVFLKLLEHFLGYQNVSHASLQELDTDRFAVADLNGKLANICADLKAEKLTSTGNFKMLASGDYIRAQKKHGQSFDFRNYAKLIFSTNQIPESEDQSYAYFKRWIIFIFDKIFQGEEKDTNIIEKLTTDAELSGLLNLALIALKQLNKDNGFVHSDDIKTVKKEYNKNANTVYTFLADHCNTDMSDRCCFSKCRDLYYAYISYCKNKNIIPLADNAFGSYIISKGIKKERRSVNGVREYCYIGISVSDNDNDL